MAEIEEIWKPVKDYEGLYEVSNFGRVKRLERKILYAATCKRSQHFHTVKEMLLSPTNNGYGYLIVSLKFNKKRKNHYVHRLVAEAFISDIPCKKVINHKDYNRANNALNNLEIVTQKENTVYSLPNRNPYKKTNPKSGFKHIRFRNNRYQVDFRWKNKTYYYGSYSTLQEALEVRERVHGEINYYG